MARRGGGPVTGPDRVADRLVDVAAVACLEEVVGELGHVRLGVRGVKSLEHLADLTVEARAAGGCQLFVERLADQRVGERVAAYRARHLRHHAGRHRLLEGFEEAIRREVGETLESVEPELAANHRRGGENAIALRRQVVEAAADHLAHALGDGDGPGVNVLGLLQTAVGDEQADDLVHEEGVALRLAEDRGDHALVFTNSHVQLLLQS